MGICDFCSSKNVVRQYECMDFNSESADAGVLYGSERGPENVVLASKDYWAACAPCAKLIDAGDLNALVERVIVEQKVRPATQSILRPHLHHTYRLFMQNRIRVDTEGK